MPIHLPIMHLLGKLGVTLLVTTFASLASAESGRVDYDLDDDGLIEINDLSDLNEIRNNLEAPKLYAANDGCPASGCIGFELSADLDFDTNGDGVMDASDTYWNSGEGWEPIGDEDASFAAIFDGNDFTIKNLYINRSTNNIGLFGAVEGATLQNLHINGDLTSITGNENVGAFIGKSNNFASTLSNCSVSGLLESTSAAVGGLVGLAYELVIQSCEVDADISVTGVNNSWLAGGMVGRTYDALTVSGSTFTGNITATAFVGGIAGSIGGPLTMTDSVVSAHLVCEETGGAGGITSDLNYTDTDPSNIERVFVQGTINCVGEIAAGFVSDTGVSNTSVTFTDSFSSMSINGERSVAGLFGDMTSDITVNRVIAAGRLTGSSDVGGLVGQDYASGTLNATDTYWDTESTGQSTTDGNGTGLTTTQLQCPTSPGDDNCNAIYTSWDESIWDFGSNSQYPGLIINGTVYRFTDSDNDGVADDYDVDSDNDGLIEIDDLAGLDEIRNNLDGSALFGSSLGCPDSGCNGFELTADLDFDTNGDGVLDTNDEFYLETGFATGWQSIPISGAFIGIFDGNGFSIRNLFIESTVATQGLFRAVNGAEFRNIVIEGDLTNVSSSSQVGLLFGQAVTSNVTISNCSISGAVATTSVYAGGIGGSAQTASVSNCTVEATVSSGSNFAGGFFGYLDDDSTISDSSFKGDVTGPGFVAGFVGFTRDIEISNSFVVADIVGSGDYVGGFIGQESGDNSAAIAVSIENSFVMGSVSGLSRVGGFIGYASTDEDVIIRNSFVGSSVSGEDVVGGLIGMTLSQLTLEHVFMYGAISNTGSESDPYFGGLVGQVALDGVITTTQSYWDTEATTQTSTANDIGTGLTTSELQCPTSPGDDRCTSIYSGWDESLWDFGTASQYPGLILSSLIYRDSDGDGVHDLEDEYPEDASESADSDGDGIGDNEETTQGMDPNDSRDYYVDTDGDGIYDGYEVEQGTDRNDVNDFVNPLNTTVNGAGYFEYTFDSSLNYESHSVNSLAQGDDGYVYFVLGLEIDGGDGNELYYSRFDSELNIDSSFGNDGFVYLNDFAQDSYGVDEIRFETDGSRLITLRNCDSNDCMLALDADGALSTSRFQTQTTAGIFDFGIRASSNRLALTTSDGSQLFYYGTSVSDGSTRVMRIDTSDEIDINFSSGNTYLTIDSYDGAGSESPLGLFEPIAGEFAVFARQDNNLYMAKFDINGDLDTSFGDSGIISDVLGTSFQPLAVIEDQAGGYLALAKNKSGSIQGLYVYKLFSDGSIDTRFGTNGYFELLEPHANIIYTASDVFQQGDGHILLPFSVNNGISGERAAGLVKLTADGLVDESYGFNGMSLYQLSDMWSPGIAEMTADYQIVMSGNGNDDDRSYFLMFANTNDQDADGVVDSDDAFPNDASEWSDSDLDGVGDNSDVFPNDDSETTDTDNDGVGDNADAFPNDDSETTDTDGDGIGGNSDSTPFGDDADTDNDGMSDGFEVLYGFDIYVATDAVLDSDGDGLTNLEEYLAGLDPSVDDVVPVLVVPADIEVNSTGATTSVDLGVASANDALDGTLTPSADNNGPFVAGRHTITWSVSDSAGNTATDTQIVDVVPQISVAASQTVAEGEPISVMVNLNGEAVAYPVSVNYSIAGTADAEDHDAVNGVITIESGLSETLVFTTVADDVFEGPETLILTLDMPTNAVLGNDVSQTVQIVEDNVTPTVQLVLKQNGVQQAVVYADAGEVTIEAIVTDPNVAEQHSYTWLASELTANNGTTGDTFTFDPVAGIYELTLTVTDLAGASTHASMTIRVDAQQPELSDAVDTDGDGISDVDEGLTDTDGDRIPDYLDPQTAANLLPADTDGSLMQASTGTQVTLGDVSYGAGLAGARMTLAQLMTYFWDDYIANLDGQLLHGVFDFEVHNVAIGESIQVVLPLSYALLANTQYQKYVSGIGWQPMLEDGNNFIETAPSTDGSCPAPGDISYLPGLAEGDQCVQLTLVDGGANDADGEANGVMVELGGVVTGTVALPTISTISNDISEAGFEANDGEAVILDFVLNSDSTDAILESLTLQSSGNTDEAIVNAVNLYLDSNNNGVAEANELLGEGSYSADNDLIEITLENPYQLGLGENRILITHTF